MIGLIFLYLEYTLLTLPQANSPARCLTSSPTTHATPSPSTALPLLWIRERLQREGEGEGEREGEGEGEGDSFDIFFSSLAAQSPFK